MAPGRAVAALSGEYATNATTMWSSQRLVA